MGTNLECDRLIEKRNSVLDSMIDHIESWDGTVENGIEIVETNGDRIKELSSINENLVGVESEGLRNEEYREKILLLTEKQEWLISNLKAKQRGLLKLMRQVLDKDKVLNSYVSKPMDSIFVDKDIY